MILSSSMLKTAVEKFQHQRRLKERYSKYGSVAGGMNAAFTSFTLVVALVFFILELVVLFYAIGIAINCTQGGPERIVNVVLAVTFTIPYAMLNILFNQCAKSTLRSGGLLGNGTSPI
jgi:hypothetical protein